MDIQRKNRGMVFIAHNAEYDILSLCPDNPFKFFDDILYRGSHFIAARKCVWTDGKRKEYVRFWDSYRFLLSGLEKIGNVMGFKKLSIPDLLKNPDNLSYERVKKSFKTTSELENYCLRDCEVLYKAVDNFQDFIYDSFGVALRPTISSIAFNIFKKNFLNEDWDTCESPINFAFKNSYYGGRVEVFRFGKSENIYYYDINSLYPFCGLMDYPHPYKLHYTDKQKNVKKYHGCGLFDIKTPDKFIPILPFRRDKLLFPNGKFQGWYNFNEINYAIENGYECDLKYGYFSYRTTNPLREYYKNIYSKRLYYPKIHYYNLILKYLLNSLYGRFGLKIENKEYMYDYEFWSNKIHYPDWDFMTLLEDGYGYAYNRNSPYFLSESTYYAIPSYLTSYARVHLHKFLKKYQKNLIYCDTDSMILDRPLPEKFISENMGDFKFEGKYKRGWFLGLKFYVLDNGDDLEVTIKGIRFNERLKKIENLPNKKIVKSFFKTKESLRRKKKSGSYKEIEKKINPWVFDKRNFNRNIDYRNQSVTTYPIIINNP